MSDDVVGNPAVPCEVFSSSDPTPILHEAEADTNRRWCQLPLTAFLAASSTTFSPRFSESAGDTSATRLCEFLASGSWTPRPCAPDFPSVRQSTLLQFLLVQARHLSLSLNTERKSHLSSTLFHDQPVIKHTLRQAQLNRFGEFVFLLRVICSRRDGAHPS